MQCTQQLTKEDIEAILIQGVNGVELSKVSDCTNNPCQRAVQLCLGLQCSAAQIKIQAVSLLALPPA